MLVTNASSNSGASGAPVHQILSFTNSTMYGPVNPNNLSYSMSLYATPAMAPTNTSRGSTIGQIFPAFQAQPSTSTGLNLGISNAMATAAFTEVAIGATVTATILGTTSLTYINVGGLPFSGSTTTGFSTSAYGVLLLWQ
jgi:hypothetical protein